MMQVKACSNFSLFLLYLMIPSTSSNFLMGEPNVPRNTKLYITAALIDINISAPLRVIVEDPTNTFGTCGNTKDSIVGKLQDLPVHYVPGDLEQDSI
ncbi:hypothetical protein WA026_020850 [Henosepilachna vigintioctopunctata]|uniref:Uncharacterized protein n=1 Tax=Henosepilachna vigintioctopunctata TaxID=420089 RepID=A0AAW1UMM4_9CUCU